jgi:RHS repeat-associated protein
VPDLAKGYVTDYLGSILNGDVAGPSHSFGTFGELTGSPSVGPSSSPVSYGFTGSNLDAATGCYLSSLRAYSPKLGRWLTQEPLGAGADENAYRYVHNIEATANEFLIGDY